MESKLKLKYKLILLALVSLALGLFAYLYPYSVDSAILNPKGLIALKERDLIYIATLLMLIVVIPVFILAIAICLRYRASNKNAEYSPDWNHDVLAESIWWGFPFLIVLFLSVVVWKSSHELDPYKPLETSVKPINIQVVALRWKWLFIYPDFEIASLNFMQFPEQTPLNLELTSDAPMNSLWIPELGGQIYAMPGMATKLHLLSHEVGDFRGSSANISGEGFASMNFIARSSTLKDFEEWVAEAQKSPNLLDRSHYNKLMAPTQGEPPTFYHLEDKELFDHIVMKYMMPSEYSFSPPHQHKVPNPKTNPSDMKAGATHE